MNVNISFILFATVKFKESPFRHTIFYIQLQHLTLYIIYFIYGIRTCSMNIFEYVYRNKKICPREKFMKREGVRTHTRRTMRTVRETKRCRRIASFFFGVPLDKILFASRIIIIIITRTISTFERVVATP